MLHNAPLPRRGVWRPKHERPSRGGGGGGRLGESSHLGRTKDPGAASPGVTNGRHLCRTAPLPPQCVLWSLPCPFSRILLLLSSAVLSSCMASPKPGLCPQGEPFPYNVSVFFVSENEGNWFPLPLCHLNKVLDLPFIYYLPDALLSVFVHVNSLNPY